MEQHIVATIAPSTIRRWLRADKIKPWRYHWWQHSIDPQFVEKAVPVLDLYAQAPVLQAQGELIVCADENASIQARQRLTTTKAAAPGTVVHVADRSLQTDGGTATLLCSGRGQRADLRPDPHDQEVCRFQRFPACIVSEYALCWDHCPALILDNGPTHAPKPLGTWLASLELPFEVRLYWLPKHVSWLDQVEIIFSKVQRDLLTPNDFLSRVASKRDLATYFVELNTHPKPIKWTYTKTKLLAKFEAPPSQQLAA